TGSGRDCRSGSRLDLRQEVAVQRCHDLGALADRGGRRACPSGTSRRRSVRGQHRCFHVPCRSPVSEVRLALPNFYNITIRIANVAADVTVLVLWFGDKLGPSISPEFIASLNIRNADIQEAADGIGVGGDAKRYRGFVGCRTAPDVDNEPRVRDLDVPRRAAAVASAENATSEDFFVKSSRSFDIGDGEKICDGKPVQRRYLIVFLLDLDWVHRRYLLEYKFRQNTSGSVLWQ